MAQFGGVLGFPDLQFGQFFLNQLLVSFAVY